MTNWVDVALKNSVVIIPSSRFSALLRHGGDGELFLFS